ncbi:MAG: hypothetical protein AB7U85_09175 [Alphaproteobacteria bacterium]
MRVKFFLVFVLLITLAACGTDIKDRTQGGAAAGATAGATVGMWGGPAGMLVGGLIGGGMGALTGASVPQENVDLGEPVWKKND